MKKIASEMFIDEIFIYFKHMKPVGDESTDEHIYRKVDQACKVVDFILDNLYEVEDMTNDRLNASVKKCSTRAKECLEYWRDRL